jgi:DNA-binding NarL/FixJ family response regulator
MRGMFTSDGTPDDRWPEDAAAGAPGDGASTQDGPSLDRADGSPAPGPTWAPAERITLLICDDHRLLTDTLSTVVESDDSLIMVRPPVHEPEEAIDIAAIEHPDVVLMDIRFNGPMSGIEATRLIKDVSPTTKVVIMTAHEDARLLVEAVEAGASGFLRKTEGLDEFLGAVKAAAAGEILIDRVALAQLLPLVARERAEHREAELLLSQLTDREHEVLQLLAEGHRNEAIAAKLFISPQTVQTYVRNVLAKLGVHSKLEAVTFAVRFGAVTV